MSSNPGLRPDGTPNYSYQQKINYYSASAVPSRSSQPDSAARNIGYNRPPQQQPPPLPPPGQHVGYPPYYNSLQPPAPPPQQHQQPPPPPYSLPQQPAANPYPGGPTAPPAYQGPPYAPQQPQAPYPQGQYAQHPIPQQQPQPYPGAAPTLPPYHQQPQQPQHPANRMQQPQYPGQNPHGMPSHFQPSGRRKALLVGINYRGTSAELRGCVRDVTFVYHLLTTKFGFQNSDFVVLTDEHCGISGVRRGPPTRRVIIDSLRWLVADTRPGDSLWFSFSGHGSQVRDTSGDEDDGYDETILPVDYKKNGQIIDDELYAIVRRICLGARLTVLLDACHSGTGLDLPYQHDVFGTGSGQRISGTGRPSFANGIAGVAGAALNGNLSGALSAGLNLVTGRKKKQHTGPDPNAGEVLLFSGCKDNQTSADTSKLSGGLTTGAMTYALIETLEHTTVGDWRNYTYRKLLQTMRQKLRVNRMTQIPQFSTSHPFDLGSQFVI